jgi:hypothetical protein
MHQGDLRKALYEIYGLKYKAQEVAP